MQLLMHALSFDPNLERMKMQAAVYKIINNWVTVAIRYSEIAISALAIKTLYRIFINSERVDVVVSCA